MFLRSVASCVVYFAVALSTPNASAGFLVWTFSGTITDATDAYGNGFAGNAATDLVGATLTQTYYFDATKTPPNVGGALNPRWFSADEWITSRSFITYGGSTFEIPTAPADFGTRSLSDTAERFRPLGGPTVFGITSDTTDYMWRTPGPAGSTIADGQRTSLDQARVQWNSASYDPWFGGPIPDDATNVTGRLTSLRRTTVQYAVLPTEPTSLVPMNALAHASIERWATSFVDTIPSGSVPVPSTVALLVAALLGMASVGSRKRLGGNT